MNTERTRPRVIRDPGALHREVAELRRGGKKVGLVPTMGALHQGHLSLARTALEECDVCVTTIFVNPAQFGPSEDLAKYPRTLDADLDALATVGSQIAFVPETDAVYGPGHATWIEVGAVAEPLEGQCRPGHFRGVATIVLKLFNMAGTDVAYFGQKDYQQVQVIRRMVEDLNVPIQLRVCPIVREPDGLALSSRNVYLSPDQRQRAVSLYASLCHAEKMVASGETRADRILAAVEEILLEQGKGRIDYVAVADPETLEPVEQITGETLIALAVRIGETRLIDNCLIQPPAG
ncbi:MAG: pantoate--beta-alanine ligase [Planctomycetaceae bacterium]|jgi:pantoate--beta-alanine ligase|nr:pantoate--beta-alanine ligase [Planctomycetaceae bacterium]